MIIFILRLIDRLIVSLAALLFSVNVFDIGNRLLSLSATYMQFMYSIDPDFDVYMERYEGE